MNKPIINKSRQTKATGSAAAAPANMRSLRFLNSLSTFEMRSLIDPITGSPVAFSRRPAVA